MIAILPYEPAHRAMLIVQQAQRDDLDVFRAAAGMMAERGPAFTAAEVDEDGRIVRVLVCAGLAENAPDYATCWAAFADAKGPAFVAIVRAIKRVLDDSSYQRLDMIVRCGFDRGANFARLLGFEPDATIWARARHAAASDAPRASFGGDIVSRETSTSAEATADEPAHQKEAA